MAPTLDAVLRKELGEGPMRFAPKGERSIADQIAALAPEERKCFDTLKKKWQTEYPNLPFTDEMYLRFARCSPGKNKFVVDASWKVMKKFDRRYLKLTAKQLEEQLLSKTLFPVPGLKTSEGHSVFYMRPARYFPSQTTTEQIIDNLVYCMSSMCSAEKDATEGLGFLANMNDWKMDNFSLNYCYQFMMTLQGRVPVRVRMFLIVNPPSWFGKIWAIMKPMLAADFRKKIHVIPETRLSEFLGNGFEMYIPDELGQGKANTQAMVQDFITYRKRIEA